MKKVVFLVFILFSLQMFSQSNWEKFKKLSQPKKMWVIFHPFKAEKALKISKEANKVADSIAKTFLLDGDASGGQVDAFRHGYWMARLNQEIGEKAARSLGKAHEKENYLMFKERKLEESTVPDKISSEMDLYNNDVGITLTTKGQEYPKKGVIYRVINAILAGKMKVIKKDKKGHFVNCKGKRINPKILLGKWKNNKCLVDSNYRRQ